MAWCHYCYLQSYFKNPDLVKFTNWPDYLDFIYKFLKRLRQQDLTTPVVFYDGDFQDSFSPISLSQDIEQINQLLGVLEQFENVFVEVRTKLSFAKKGKTLEERFNHFVNLNLSHPSLVVGITFSPDEFVKKFEPGTAKLEDRIAFAKYVVSRWGKMGIRLDPIILLDAPDINLKLYVDLLKRLLNELPSDQIWNIGVGTLRFKDSLYKRLKKSGSELVKGLGLEDGFWRYPKERRYITYDMIKSVTDKVYVCMDEE